MQASERVRAILFMLLLQCDSHDWDDRRSLSGQWAVPNLAGNRHGTAGDPGMHASALGKGFVS